jgi:serine/threonine protein kinase
MAFKNLRDKVANTVSTWLGRDAAQPSSQLSKDLDNMDRKRTLRNALSKRAAPSTFLWNPRQWTTAEELTNDVRLLRSTESSNYIVVKKTMKLNRYRKDADIRPTEIRTLANLPDCNRILKPLHYERTFDGPFSMGIAIFPLCPMGDVSQWKKNEFDKKRFKPVPESYIWRFLIQMAQAVAFMHNELSPSSKRSIHIHRDIKPKNILVVSNGSTYPSFKLHDFGLATTWDLDKARQPTFCGTYEWQAPENPFVNTMAADVWSLGACVHFLATGHSPIGDVDEFKRKCRQERNGDPASVRDYGYLDGYYDARVRREVTRIDEPFRQGPDGAGARPPRQYSEAMYEWMVACLRPDTAQRAEAGQLVEAMIPEATLILQKMGGNAALRP